MERLRLLGLNSQEAKLYVELLKEPATHLRLAHATGINRTKIYRLASDLEKRSLITRRTDDRGTFLVAADPATLEVALITQEARLKAQRQAFDALLPMLTPLKQADTHAFIVHTYEGKEGFQQMLWHELKTKGENLIFGRGNIDDLAADPDWGEKHRQLTVDAGYTIREILNPGETTNPFTLNEAFMERFRHRLIATDVLLLKIQISIYNDTVATYHWREDQKVGVEIINRDYAQMMRQLFERYWQLAKPGGSFAA